MKICSHTKEYEVKIYKEFTFWNDLLNMKNCLWVIDETVYHLYRNQLFQKEPPNILLLSAVEENKVIDMALTVCEKMSESGLKRNAVLISVGGGITQDITGFAANILYRGVRWIFVPTTLLAACDSCIGGKTSLNYKHYKNLLGTFYSPDEIMICPDFFDTLSQNDFESGLGEVVKFNVMAGEDGIAFLENHMEKLLRRDKELLNRVVERSLRFKKQFIEEDEFDRGERVKLNFAHTFGHAFETMSGYLIPHGTAVAMGTIAANHISLERGWLEENIVRRIQDLLLQIIHVDPKKIALDEEQIIRAMHKDKKQTDDAITTVLMKGKDLELCVERNTEEEEIKRAVEYLFHLLKAGK